MTKIDEDLKQREWFSLFEVDSKVRNTSRIKALNYLYLALCVYSW